MVVSDEENRTKAYEQMEDDKETVGVLKDIAMKYDSIVSFLDSIVLDATPTVPTEGKVILSTIHSAKGMEWEHVDIMDCMDGITPELGAEHEDAMEDLRCFYVALTRAKDEEVLYAPYSAMICGKQYSNVTPFLSTCFDRGLLKLEASHKALGGESKKKIYLNVDYYEKNTAKSYGARWDADKRCWFVFEDHQNAKKLLMMYGQAYF